MPQNKNPKQKGLDLLHGIFSKYGLSINIKKTKSMIFNFEYIKEHYDSTYPESIAELQNQVIENVKTFRYFRDEIKFEEPSTGTAEINLRISLAEAKLYKLKNKITNYKILLKTRVLILNSMVRSRLTYSSQTWNISIAEMNRINSVYIGMLRKLVRNGSKTEEFRFLMTNQDILHICRTDDIGTFVSKQQFSYLAHMAQQSNQCLTKRLLFNANTRTKIGRPTETLEDKVMKNFRENKCF